MIAKMISEMKKKNFRPQNKFNEVNLYIYLHERLPISPSQWR